MLKSCEAFFVYTHLNMANLIPFTKRFESSENLVDLLESRGLHICDRNKAIQYLDNIGYYRLSAYMYPLLKMPKTAHLYKEGSTFKKVMMLYRFDKKLRLLMFNEIEKIEIAIRRAVMQITADMTGNPFWLTDSSYFLDSSRFNETMRAISKEYSKSKEEFILHFKRTYSEPYPPSWILGELLTIGNVNAIYRNIKQNRIRKRIAKRFGLPINVFESWLTVIAVTRNACGHHSRVWNKQNAIQPAIPNSPAGEWITQPTDSMRAYFDLCMSCKLGLSQWQDFAVNVDSIFPNTVHFQFVFQPYKLNEIRLLLKRERFNHSVYIDKNNKFNKLNKFPSNMNFQTFLLDRNNRVIAIGNPIYNPKVKELYLKIIKGEKIERRDESKVIKTEVDASNISVSLGRFDWQEEQKATFILKNVGDKPLVIQDVATSCGCTTVAYSKEPALPGKEIALEVVYKAEHPEHFDKTITVYCNTENSPLVLKISGDAK